jgi:hypothetical protein
MVSSSSLGFHFIVSNPALFLVILQFLTYEIATELGKEKLESEGDLEKT